MSGNKGFLSRLRRESRRHDLSVYKKGSIVIDADKELYELITDNSIHLYIMRAATEAKAIRARRVVDKAIEKMMRC